MSAKRQKKVKAFPFLADPPVPSHEKYKGIIEYPGFHTTGSFEIAAMYAVGRVEQFYRKTEDDVHFVTDYPVVVQLNMTGFEAEVDYDAAEIVKDTLFVHLDELKSELGETPTDEEIVEAAQNLVEYSDHQFEVGPDADPLDFISENTFMHFSSPLSAIYEDPEFPEAVRGYFETGSFPERLLMEATDQYRYTKDVPSERVEAIYYVTPVANEMFRWDQEEEEEFEKRWPGFQAVGEDDAYGDYFSPEYQEVWKNTQLALPGLDEARVEYHGTTYHRMLQAAPEFAETLPQPPSPPYRAMTTVREGKNTMVNNLKTIWFNEGVREGKDTAITCIAQNIPIVDPKDLVDDKVFDRVERELFIAGFKLGVTAGKHALFQREAVIRKCKEGDSEKGKPWCLYTHDGSKLLGRHPTKESARQQEEAIKAQGG